MKNAHFLLMAVAVFALFLEPTTAKGQPSKNKKVQISDEDNQAINQAMESSEEALDRVQKVAADAVPKANAAQKLTLAEVIVWLESLDAISTVIHKQVRDAIASRSGAGMKAAIVEIAAAIEVTQTTLDGFNEKPLPSKAKKNINKDIDTVISNAAFVKETLQEYL